MFRLFSRRFRAPAFPPDDRARFGGQPPAPDEPLFVIGDVHGALDALDALLVRAARDFPAHRLVFVGDCVDRGPESAGVLARLMELGETRPETVCLRGNHEDMMLAFLSDPAGAGARWLRHGGLQTMASFGVGGLTERTPPEDLAAARDRLREAMAPGTEDWLRALAGFWQSGNVGVVHAGADPARALGEQPLHHLVWGHPDFIRRARPDGLWIVRGHQVVDQPVERNGVFSIDTGAYATGRLTGACIADGEVRFVQNV